MKTPLLRTAAIIGLALGLAACAEDTASSPTAQAGTPNAAGMATGSTYGADPGSASVGGVGFNPGSNAGGTGVGATSGH